MASTSQRYPLSTPDGVAIPLDIMKPHSFIRKAFSALTPTVAISVPNGVEIMSITTSEDVLICFGAEAVIPVDGVNYPNTVLVEASSRICIAPRAATFTMLGLQEAGIANLQFVDKWAGLALAKQLTGR